jgi:ribosomal protein S18 acetylase RimI-like enzyme
MTDTITVEILGPDGFARLMAVPEGLFDYPLRSDQARAFLSDPMHICALAYDGDLAVGMATGVIMLHPDKPPAFFVNEVGVQDEYRRLGIGQKVTAKLMDVARARGCEGIWLATETDNVAARALYRALDARETDGIVVYDWDGAMDE